MDCGYEVLSPSIAIVSSHFHSSTERSYNDAGTIHGQFKFVSLSDDV